MLENALSFVSPGMLLRQAREARNLSQETVASQLHLGVHIIDALENDNYETLPGIVFLKGYLRNYTRLLRLDETKMQQAFAGLPNITTTLHKKPAPVLRLPNRAVKVRPRFQGKKLALSLSSVIILLLLLWWYAHPVTNKDPVSASPGKTTKLVSDLSLPSVANSDVVSTQPSIKPVAPPTASSATESRKKTTEKNSASQQQLTSQLHMDLS